MTFREKGGVMPALYKLEDIIILNPTDPDALEGLKSSAADPDHIKRLEGYIKEYPSCFAPFSEQDHLFYIFSKDGTIKLPNKPKPPKKNNTNIAYYTLKDILEKETVSPAHEDGKTEKRAKKN
jgi:hypothetical protein